MKVTAVSELFAIHAQEGGLGLGSAGWGVLAERVGTPTALALSGVALVVSLAAIPRWRLAGATTLDLTPSAHWSDPHVAAVPAADAGPVQVQVEYGIDPQQAGAFSAAMHELGAVRRRDGAIAWTLYQDPAEPGRYVEVFIVESWVEHLRQHERVTRADRAIQERARGFHRGTSEPTVTHLIASRREVPPRPTGGSPGATR